MKPQIHRQAAILAASLALLGSGCDSGAVAETKMNPTKVTKRVGMVVGLKSDQIAEYKRLHADDHPGVRDLLSNYHIQNFSIYLHQIDDKWYEFGYYEYTGDDFEGDMKEDGCRAAHQGMAESLRPDADPASG
jgi:L-rhamnose mutarotase